MTIQELHELIEESNELIFKATEKGLSTGYNEAVAQQEFLAEFGIVTELRDAGPSWGYFRYRLESRGLLF